MPPLFRTGLSTLFTELARIFGSVPVHDYCSRRFSVFSAWQRGGNIYPAGVPLQDLPFFPGIGITGRRERAEIPAAGNAGGTFAIHAPAGKSGHWCSMADCSCSGCKAASFMVFSCWALSSQSSVPFPCNSLEGWENSCKMTPCFNVFLESIFFLNHEAGIFIIRSSDLPGSVHGSFRAGCEAGCPVCQDFEAQCYFHSGGRHGLGRPGFQLEPAEVEWPDGGEKERVQNSGREFSCAATIPPLRFAPRRALPCCWGCIRGIPEW